MISGGGAVGIQVIRPGEGERVDACPIKMLIIEDGSHTGHRMGLISVSLPAGPAQPPQHIHREHDESFIVTAGRIRFTSGDTSVDADAGSVVVVPPGVPHTFGNPFEETAAMLCAVTPDLYIQYFRDLTKLPLNAQGMLAPADIGRTMARYATDVVRLG